MQCGGSVGSCWWCGTSFVICYMDTCQMLQGPTFYDRMHDDLGYASSIWKWFSWVQSHANVTLLHFCTVMMHQVILSVNNNNNNKNQDNVYGAVIMTKVIARVHPVHLMNVDWAPGGCQPSDQASRLGLWVHRKLAATIHIHLAIVIITQPTNWHSFYHLMEGERLSWPTHRSKSAQPLPKAAAAVANTTVCSVIRT